ncbi:MAG: hypothetical protein KGO82_13650 [Bacteroidota bacterium]|nr:hypothetical protein [Bacteroidota bacterium]
MRLSRSVQTEFPYKNAPSLAGDGARKAEQVYNEIPAFAEMTLEKVRGMQRAPQRNQQATQNERLNF